MFCTAVIPPSSPPPSFKRVQEAEARRAEDARRAFVAEVEEWSQGEVAAVRADAEARVEAAQSEAAEL